MRNNRGFTLVELIVTIAVLAIIASIAVPSFSDLVQTYQSNQSKEQMMKALKEGRSRAAALKASVMVCPNKDGANQQITTTICLTKSGVSSSDVSKYIDDNRVILATIDKVVSVSGDMNVVFSAIGSSLDNATSVSPKAKKITLCGNKELSEITISILGVVTSEKKGTCS